MDYLLEHSKGTLPQGTLLACADGSAEVNDIQGEPLAGRLLEQAKGFLSLLSLL